MVIKRYILTIAVSNAEAARFTEKLVEDCCTHGLDLEPGCGPASIVFADERSVDYPDYEVDRNGEKAAEAWYKRAEDEVYGS